MRHSQDIRGVQEYFVFQDVHLYLMFDHDYLLENFMSHLKLDRRTFLGGAASALSLAALPSFAQISGQRRLEWQQFKVAPDNQYSSFLYAVGRM
ncbi:hypothetical protein, partial [Caballeronia terrestris]|uniref:hypothetical protein n=1 Tax=Caballeronia terrestris TaxID=1226301 RepID=UPI001F40EBF7